MKTVRRHASATGKSRAKKPTYPSKLHELLRTTHGVRYFVVAIVLTIATGLGLWWMIANIEMDFTNYSLNRTAPDKPVYYSPLTGNPVDDEATTQRAVTAIVIENSPEARPQSGLKDAGVVYEAVAEGGITRFLALYQETRPELIGPVRSLRPYYVEWASAYDPAVAHIGGSQRALQMIRSGNYGVDMDEFLHTNSFWRSTDRYAPHNVYTNFDRLDSLRQSKDKTTSQFTGFLREDTKKPLPEPTATQVSIGVSSGRFAVSYTYNTESNSYIRFQGGEAHVDREAGQISPRVVVAIKVPMHHALEGDGYREQITTTGTGPAYVFQNGSVIEATWQKDSASAPLKLIGADGNQLTLARGSTWITALASDRSVSWQ